MSGRHARTRWSGSAVAAAVLAGVLVVPVLPPAPAAATPPPPPMAGAVDTGFGTEGQLTVDVLGGSAQTVPLGSPVRTPDGDLVTGLAVHELVGGELTRTTWWLARSTADGVLEPRWDEDGLLQLDVRPEALVVEPRSGDVVLFGGSSGRRVLRRLGADGQPVAAFGDDGTVEDEGTSSATALALQGERLLLGYSDGKVQAVHVATGASDTTFGSTDGQVQLGARVEALAVDAAQNVYAAVDDDTNLVVRLRPDGAPDATAPDEPGWGDPAFESTGRTGQVRLDGMHLRDLVVRPDGSAVVIGDLTDVEEPVDAVRSFDVSGDHVAEQRVPYGAEADPVSLEDAALDDQGRVLLAGTWYDAGDDAFSLLARIGRDGRLDPGFGQDQGPELGQAGVQLSSCGPTGSGSGIVSSGGRIVLVSGCDSGPSGTSRALLSAYHAEPGGISDLVLTADAPEVAAAPSTVHTAEVPAEALEAALDEVASSPLRYSPLRYSPLRYSPLRYSPLRYSPLRYSPLDTAALAEVTLAQVPLAYVPGAVQDWDEVLLGTKYEGHPLASVYVREVLALEGVPGTPDLAEGQVTEAKAAQIAALQLERIDLSRTAYRDATLAGLLLPDTPLAALPEPQGGWCAYLQGQLDPCPSLSEATLLLLTVAGVDLEPWLALAQPLAGRDLRETPLGSVPLAEVDLERTALGQLPVADLQGSSRFCSAQCSGTLAEAEVPEDVTLGVLLHDGLPAVQSPVASLVDLVAGLLEPEDVPWEALELDGVLDALPVDPADPSTTYRAQFTASCDVLDETLTAQVLLPEGARYVPGTARLSVPGGDVPVDVTLVPRSGMSRKALVAVETGWLVTAVPRAQVECADAEPLRATYSLRAIAPRELAPTRAGAVVQSGPARLSVSEQAPVDVRDPHDLPIAEDGEPQVAPLSGDTLTLGYLGRRGAADYYSVPVSPGSTVTLTLSHLRADFDLLVYDDLPVDPDGTPAAVENTPLRYSPLRYSPLRYSPTDDAEAGTDATVALPEDLQGVPLLDKRLRRASAARGEQVEAVRVRVREGEPDRLIVGVVPFNGAAASTPYVLHTDVEGPQELPDCSQERTFVAAAPAVTTPLPEITSETQSLVLVHRARMTALHGSGVEGSGGLWEALQAYAAHPLVKGAVLDVGSDPEVRAAYAALDDDPCSVPAANEVVSRINQLVDEIRGPATQLRFVTLIGDDEALPMGRVPDLTDVANQVDHASATRVGELDNAVSRAFAQGYLLSDDPYGSLAPSAFLDTQLFVPDLAVGRLVETPAEIRASLVDFSDKGGKRPLSGAFVSSYDFLTDLGAQLSDLSEAQGRSTTSRNDETWTRDDARTGVAQNPSGLLSVNAHFDQYRALPADQDAKGTQDQLLEASTDLPPSLSGSLLVTVGCNAGLNLSDLLLRTVADESEQEVARTRDWAQLTSSRGGVLIANTGFGYGDDTAIAYSERLVRHVVAGLDGSRTLGQALLFAKQQYLEASVFGVYDHKAVQQATFYGLPQWRIGDNGGLAPAVLPEAPPSNDVTTATTTTEAPSVQARTSDRGTWYQVGDELPQVTAHRPVQPRTTSALTAPASGLVAHGALLNGLVTRDVELADPAVSVPITDLAAAQPEPPVRDAFFPTTLVNVVSRSAPTGGRDQLVLVPGQYRGNAVGQPGTQRLVDEAQVEVTWSGSSDFLPPVVPVVQGVLDPAGGRVGFTVQAPDEDTERVVVLYLPAAAGGTAVAWRRLELQREPSGAWTGAADVPSWSEEVGQFLVQAVDRAGNVTTNSNKGFNYRATPLLEASSFDLAVAEATGSATVTVVEQQATTASTSTPSKAYRYTVNGSPSQPYPANGVVLGPGSHVVEVTDELGQVDQALVVVLGEVRIDVRTPVEGATYPATGMPSSFSCTTPLGPATSCEGPARLESAVGEHVFTVTSGGTSRDVRYRVVAPASLTVDAPPAVTVTDPVTVAARLLRWDGAPLPGRTVAFALGGAGASGTTGPDGSGRAGLVPQGPAGTQELSATAEGATVRRDVSVAAEQVTVTYTGDLLRAAPSLTSTSGPVTLSARVVQPDDGGLGDLAARAEVVFAVTGDDGVTRSVRATTRKAADGGRALVASATATLPVGVHLVVPSVTGGWFAGTGAEAPVVLHWPDGAPSLTGAGLVDARQATTVPSPVSTSRTDGWFGVHTALRTVKQKDRTVQEVKGVAAYGYTAADGTRWWFTGRTPSQVSFPRNGHTATLSGPVSVLTVAGDGSVRKVPGDHTWQVDGADGKASRNVNDKDGVAYRVLDGSGKEVLVVGSATAPLPLRRGEVVIRK